MRSPVFSGFALLVALTVMFGAGYLPSNAQDATPASCPATSEEENMALVRRWYEDVYNERNLEAIDELLSDNYTRNRAGIPFTNDAGNADDRAFVELLMGTFPDVQFSIEDVFASGDKVTVRTIMTGTQMGPMVDIGNAPATNQSMTRENIAIWRVECGELAEQWFVQDNLGMLRQLGLITDEELSGAVDPEATPAP
jgi:predicted ester cyclase